MYQATVVLFVIPSQLHIELVSPLLAVHLCCHCEPGNEVKVSSTVTSSEQPGMEWLVHPLDVADVYETNKFTILLLRCKQFLISIQSRDG